MTHADLFSGIGGFSIAAEQMEWENIFMCEINPFCRNVLKQQFTGCELLGDIKSINFRKYAGTIDILTGGFPCQPFSLAGDRKGADDDRYLWPEMLRAIREIRPTWVIGENVAGIISMVQPGSEINVEGQASLFEEDYQETILEQEYVVETICRDLEREGYSVQPIVIPACAVGAPHRRDRVWFLAHSDTADAGIKDLQSEWENTVRELGASSYPYGNDAGRRGYGETGCEEGAGKSEQEERERIRGIVERVGGEGIASDTSSPRQSRGKKGNFTKEQERIHVGIDRHCCERTTTGSNHFNGNSTGLRSGEISQFEASGVRENYWQNFPTQSPIHLRDDGLRSRLVRYIRERGDGVLTEKEINKIVSETINEVREQGIKAAGNAIVPQVALELFRAIE